MGNQLVKSIKSNQSFAYRVKFHNPCKLSMDQLLQGAAKSKQEPIPSKYWFGEERLGNREKLGGATTYLVATVDNNGIPTSSFETAYCVGVFDERGNPAGLIYYSRGDDDGPGKRRDNIVGTRSILPADIGARI